MIEGALEADGRIAAKNAVKIRAALRQVTDFKRVFNKYQETQPQPTDNTAQDRTRARSWLILNVYMNDEPLRQTVMRAWAEAYVLGHAAAGEWIAKTEKANKAADDGYIDWDNWKPGDQATALLLRPTGGFSQYLNAVDADSYFKKFNKETVENLGTALSDAIAAGLDAEHAAVMIGRHVASPSRALTIAITEQNRAMSFGSIQRYKEAELEKMEWHTSDPCDKCAKNGGVEVIIGQAFPSGNTQPPAHPHCRCVLLPVIPGMNEEPSLAPTAPVITPTPTPVSTGAWTKVDEQAWVDRQIAVRARDPRFTDPYNEIQLKILRDQAKDADIYQRGVHILRVDKNLINPPSQQDIQQFMANFDEVYERLPAWRRFDANGVERGYNLIINGEASGNTLAYTYLGHDTVWFSVKDIKTALDAPKDWKGWFMSSANNTNENLYTIAHEFGHTVDSFMNANRGKVSGALRRKYPELFSRYSAKNAKEAYAEVFAEWLLGVRNPVTETYATRFGWDLSVADYYSVDNRMIQWQPNMRSILMGN
jgi:hypothetical protein